MTTMSVRSDREVDALVAEHVMGWQVLDSEIGTYKVGQPGSARYGVIPMWASDPTDCAALKKKLRDQGFGVFVEIYPDDEPVDCSVISAGGTEYVAKAATEERAVALAALKAHGVDPHWKEPAA